MRTERANAKINLFLDVVGKRENGYHEILSVMQAVSLCDLVTLDYRPDIHTKIELTASGNASMPTDCRNLAYRAAELFLEATGRRGEVKILLEKHIPMAAGLAGGSTDAAAVLRGLNRLTGLPLSDEELMNLGAKLGADVPFCIHGGTALASGIGEILEEKPEMPDCTLVIACMGGGISTPEAYGNLDLKFGNFAEKKSDRTPCERIFSAFCKDNLQDCLKSCYDIFEETVPEKQPYVNLLKEKMLAGGAEFAMMSGSGPSVFGIFPGEKTAGETCMELRGLGADAFVCHPMKKQ